METQLPQISPLGWYVKLPEPADSLVRKKRQSDDRLETVAGLAQAHLFMFQHDQLKARLKRLESAGGQYSRLAKALRAEALMRRGRYDEARSMLGRLALISGPLGAWAGLREAEALELLGRVQDAKLLLAESRKRREDEPALLRPMVEARLLFRLGKVDKAAQTLEGAVDRIDGAAEPLAASFHRAWAIYLDLMGDMPLALWHHRLALDALRRLGDYYMLAKEYLSLGQTYLEIGELDHAEFFYLKATETAEEMDHSQIEALLSSRLGMLALVRGDLPTACRHFDRDLKLSKKSGHRYGQAYARRNLGKVKVQLGDVAGGRMLLGESLSDFEALSDPLNRELTRLEEASALLTEREEVAIPEVRRQLDSVSRFFSKLGRPEMVALVGAVRARLLVAEGKLELARQEMESDARILLQSRRPDRVVESLLALSRSLQKRNEQEEAVYYLGWAYREAEEASRPWMASTVLHCLGQINERAMMDLVGDPPLPARSAGLPSSKRVGHFIEATRSPAFREVLDQALDVAPTDETVLIQGATGTGKEMLARTIHEHSRRAHVEMLPLESPRSSEGLIESEFFGHVPGAFTDAKSGKVGIFEAAEGGAVFLDEVGELSPHGQVTLLRFLEDHKVRRVGASSHRKVDVRIIAATNRDLIEDVRKGRFRMDLYYRLAVYPINVPPLRERREDLSALVTFFLNHNPQAQEKGIAGLSKAAMKLLDAHEWPGNLRELNNVISAAAIRCKGKQIVRRNILPSLILQEPIEEESFSSLAEITRRHVKKALRLAGGNQGRAAQLLGIHRNTMAAKLKALKLES